MVERISRLLKHRWLEATLGGNSVSEALLSRLAQQVSASERQHSGEIRVMVEAGLPLSYLWRDAPLAHLIRQRAISQFGKLRVWDTAQNNGVLIYLLLAERRIEVLADRGLSELVPGQVWQRMVSQMGTAFAEGDFETGLTLAIEQVSAMLLQHFPLQTGAYNPNELPDQPHLG
jgi:uncharacterized membrane protein